MQMNDVRLICGEALATLKTLPAESVQTCVTSPPYWGLRDYGTATWEGGGADCDHAQEAPRFNGAKQTRAQVSGHASKAESHGRKQCQKCGARRVDAQLGLEPTPTGYVASIVAIFDEVRRVLKEDGTLWLNLGDSYNAYNGGAGPSSALSRGAQTKERPNLPSGYGLKFKGLKPKDLVGIPWRVAFALQEAGWYLRSDIIWSKPNPMPESVTDRPTKAHEYLFLLSKSQRYYYDAEAIKEGLAPETESRYSYAFGGAKSEALVEANKSGVGQRTRVVGERETPTGRNKRTVWTVPTAPFPGAHFATFPPKLIEPCILAGAPEGGVVLDPFSGSGTTLAVAIQHGRHALGIELNPAYIDLANERIADARKERAAQLESLTMPLFDEPEHLPAKLFAD